MPTDTGDASVGTGSDTGSGGTGELALVRFTEGVGDQPGQLPVALGHEGQVGLAQGGTAGGVQQ